jgi:hypothetical protein
MWPNVFDGFIDSHYIDTSWRMAHNALAINETLFKYHIYHSAICPYANCTCIESAQHCFFECEVVKPVYNILLPWVDKLSVHTIPYTPNVIPCEFLRFPSHLNALSKYRKSLISYLIALVKHVIWLSRNSTKNQHKKVTSRLIIVTVYSLLKFRIVCDFKRFARDKFTKYWLSTDCFCKIVDDKVECLFL